MTNWNTRFLELAKLISTWSKDPNTKVGCVIVRQDKTIASVGFNGFPKGVEDDSKRLEDRQIKHQIVIHAEVNALLFSKENLAGYSMFTYPIIPCPRCASMIIQSGIVCVVSPKTVREKCGECDMDLTRQLFAEAGVELIEV